MVKDLCLTRRLIGNWTWMLHIIIITRMERGFSMKYQPLSEQKFMTTDQSQVFMIIVTPNCLGSRMMTGSRLRC